MPFLSCKFFASQKTYEIIAAGLLPARLRRGFGFAFEITVQAVSLQFWFCGEHGVVDSSCVLKYLFPPCSSVKLRGGKSLNVCLARERARDRSGTKNLTVFCLRSLRYAQTPP
jgi:hypothetical protein